MRLKFAVLFFLFVSILMSCDKKSSVGPYFYDTSVFVNVLDEQGNDLLDPSVKAEKSIDINKIQLIYILSENEHVQSSGVSLVKPNDEYKNYALRFSVNADKNEKEHVTLLKWNREQLDTIKSTIHFINDSAGVKCIQLIHNNDIVWDSKINSTLRMFTITK